MNKNITDISYSWNNTDDEFVRAIISLRSFRLTNSISALYQIGNVREPSVCYNNWYNLPEHILLAQGNQNTIDYLYDAAGTKLKKVTSSDRTAGLPTDYNGPFVYEDSKLFIRWLLKGCRTSLKDETGGNLDASWGGDYDTENYIIGVITVVIVPGGINSGYSFKQKPTDGCKRIPPLRRI